MNHTCHAPGCTRPTPPKMLACRSHWFALPQKIRDAVWREYRSGQEISKRASWRYMAVQRLALAHLVYKPESEKAVLEALRYLAAAVRYSKEAIKAGQGDPLEGIVPDEWPMPIKKADGRAKYL